MLEVDEIYKSYGDQSVLEGISLSLQRGRIYGLAGKNGAGKTTMLWCLSGSMAADSGSITLNGRGIYDDSIVKESIVCIPENGFLFDEMKASQIKRTYEKIYPLFSIDKFDRLCADFLIDEELTYRNLSSGHKKIVSIISGLSCNTEIILLDEPFSVVDVGNRRMIETILLEEICQRDTSILFSSHNLKGLERLCDEIFILNDRRICFNDEVDEMKRKCGVARIICDDPDVIKESEDLTVLNKNSRYMEVFLKNLDTGALESLKKRYNCRIEKLECDFEDIFIYLTGGERHE